MVVLRGGMCPGLDDDLVRELRAADIKTGQCVCVTAKRTLHLNYKTVAITSMFSCFHSGRPGLI